MLKKLIDFAENNKKKIGITVASVAGMAVLISQLSGPINNIKEQSQLDEASLEIATITNTVHSDYMTGVINNYIEEANRVVTAYELCIDGDRKFIVGSKEELELVLELVQHRAIGEKAATEVVVTKSEEGIDFSTSIVQGPELQIKLNELGLSTSGVGTKSVTSFNKNQIALKKDIILDSGDGNIVNEVESNEVVNNVEFGEKVQISKVEVNKEDVISVDEAVAILNSSNIEPTTYTVVPGDSPYEIALDNDMKLEELYKLNTDLESKAKGLQVGDEVVVMVPEPELSVVVEETIVYYDMIPKEYVYVDDDTIYESVEEIAEQGLDGTKEVTAVVKIQDGEEISREIVSEATITDQMPQKILVGTKPLPFVGPTGFFTYPVNNFRITSYYGYRSRGFHRGVDFAATTGTIISASDGGTVTNAGWSGSYGYMVEIDHGNGKVTRYGHCSAVLVKVGQVVGQHEAIAKVGSTGNSTGPHCHFEIIVNGDTVNPLDYLDK